MSYFITTPIFYVNAQPHMGHAYTAVVADVVSRFKRLTGEEVFFQTGTDEHGDKIVQAAADAGASVRDYVDNISTMFRQAWPPLEVNPDNFIRTTDPRHIQTVQAILQKVYDQGDIYLSDYSGLYCQGCEQFLTEKDLVDGKCPDHDKPPAEVSEKNYFFRMSRYQDWLIEHITRNPEFISPERYRNEVLSFLKDPLEDLCISRPTSRLTWGIALPFDDQFVTYVWFDALINYLTGIGYPDGPDFQRFWTVAEHIIAKDILKPHAIYWPTMLKAIGLEPYRKLHVHGYWNLHEKKMSKSIGNVVRPLDLVEKYGADTIRYFLMREMSFGLDADFAEEALLTRRNSDLANDLGNLFSRSLTMVRNFAGSKVPAPGEAGEQERELADAAMAMVDLYRRQMNAFAFRQALETVWNLISLANKYIVRNEPWSLAKDPDQAERLATVLYYLLETLRFITMVLHPVLPETAAKMTEALGLGREKRFNEEWGGLQPGGEIFPGVTLFPRLDNGKEKTAPGKSTPQKEEVRGTEKMIDSPEKGAENQISFETFQQLDLRVGEIVAAEKIKKSDRLLKLTVKAPEERTIVAGIARHYAPEEVIGRQVIIVANLKPAKLMGVESHGMVLAAKDGDCLLLSSLSGSVAPGSKVS